MESLIRKLSQSHKNCPECPSPKVVHTLYEDILGLLFPDFATDLMKEEDQIAEKIEELRHKLSRILIRNKHLHAGDGTEIAYLFFQKLENVYDLLIQDV